MSAGARAVRAYNAVFGALLLLLAATVGLAYVDLGPFNLLAAMSVAVVKAVLVILYFMHVRESERMVWVFAGAGALWLLIATVLTFSDYLTR